MPIRQPTPSLRSRSSGAGLAPDIRIIIQKMGLFTGFRRRNGHPKIFVRVGTFVTKSSMWMADPRAKLFGLLRTNSLLKLTALLIRFGDISWTNGNALGKTSLSAPPRASKGEIPSSDSPRNRVSESNPTDHGHIPLPTAETSTVRDQTQSTSRGLKTRFLRFLNDFDWTTILDITESDELRRQEEIITNLRLDITPRRIGRGNDRRLRSAGPRLGDRLDRGDLNPSQGALTRRLIFSLKPKQFIPDTI
jgi:hypothetical protein